MTESTCHEWLNFAYRTIVGGGAENSSPPEGELPISELERLGAVSSVFWSLEHSGHSKSEEQSNRLLYQRLENALKHRELNAIFSAFDMNDVDYRLLKGQSMWLHLYQGREEIRPVSDSDILVHPDDFERAIDCLDALGYYSDSDREQRTSNKTANQFSFVQQFGQFLNPIDLHRYPHNWPLHHRLGALALQPSQRCKIQSFSTLSKPLAFLWIACHRAKDQFKGDLREVLDAKVLLQAMSSAEADQTLELIKSLKLEHFSMLLILQTQYWFGNPLDQSNESKVLTALQQAQPKQALRTKKRIARMSNNAPAKPQIMDTRFSRQVGLFNQYREFLQTPGNRIDALSSMTHYAGSRFRQAWHNRGLKGASSND